MRYLSGPLRIPAVFLHLLIGIGLGLFLKSGLAGDELAFLQNGASLESFKLIGWLGILLLMALGTTEDKQYTGSGGWLQVSSISIMGFGGTFLVASLLGFGISRLQPNLMGVLADPLIFSFAIGLACAVTALPVLVSLLHEHDQHQSKIGRLAIRVAVFDDLWLWLVLIVVLGMVSLHANPALHLLKVCAFVVCVLFVLKPLLRYLYKKLPDLKPANRIILGLSLIVMMAMTSEAIGTHALFGAFLTGLILPAPALKFLKERLLSFSQILLLPFFFITTGMNVNLFFDSSSFIFLAALFIFAGIALKIFFVSIAARVSGLSWTESVELGTLLQCKGLMEIVALGLLYDAQIIGAQIFSALIVMALFCTVATLPLRSCVIWIRHARRETAPVLHSQLEL